MKFLWRCDYTKEILVSFNGRDGSPLFGGILPFFGWKLVASHHDGSFDPSWPPKFVVMKLGVMWFGQGYFWTAPGSSVRVTNQKFLAGSRTSPRE